MAAAHATAIRCPTCDSQFAAIEGNDLCPGCLLRSVLDSDARGNDAGIDDAEAASDPPGRGGPIGTRVGRYELLDEISRGGMGVVYRARQHAPSRIVAVKMLLPYLLQSAEMRARFRTEAEAAASLEHPGILAIYEVGEHGAMPYFSMRFAEGKSLAHRALALRGDYRRIATIIAQVALAIHHAHIHGVVHRDLKPGNILFDSLGNPMVSDFGIAKWRALDIQLTLPSAVLGSPHYMAPEQITGRPDTQGPRADIYSLGAVLYELLCGAPPIIGLNPLDVIRRVPSEIPAAPRSRAAAVPRSLAAIAMRCLEKDPAQRYATAQELAVALTGRGSGPRSSRSARLQKAARQWPRAALAASLAAVALVFALVFALALALPPARRGWGANPASNATKHQRVNENLRLARSLLIRISKEDNDRAVKLLRTSVEIEPLRAALYAALSDAYRQRGHSLGMPRFWLDSAIDQARKAIELDPGDFAGYEALGAVFYVKAWFGQAEEVLTRGLTAANSNGCSDSLANVYTSQNKFVQAHEILSRCTRAEPSNFLHAYLLAYNYSALELNGQATATLQRLIDIEVDSDKKSMLHAEQCIINRDYACALRGLQPLPPETTTGGFSSARGKLLEAATYSGEVDLAERLMGEIQENWQRQGTDSVRPELEIARAVNDRRRGDDADMRVAARRAMDRTQVDIDAGSQRPAHFLRMAIGSMLLGDPSAAHRWLEHARTLGFTCWGSCAKRVELEVFTGDPQWTQLLTVDNGRLADAQAQVLDHDRTD